MACGYNILFGYTLSGKAPIVIGPLELVSAGTYEGKDYYTWYDETAEVDLVIRWNNGGYWEFGFTTGILFSPIATLQYPPSDCPVDPAEPYQWLITATGWSDINSAFGDSLNEPLTEEQECYPILVWNKQCEFAQCVLKYLQLLQFGSAPCSALEQLKNKRRILEILNCYDVRDIPDNTTDYNTISYSEIKTLLNH
jgi:hypothetical protein